MGPARGLNQSKTAMGVDDPVGRSRSLMARVNSFPNWVERMKVHLVSEYPVHVDRTSGTAAAAAEEENTSARATSMVVAGLSGCNVTPSDLMVDRTRDAFVKPRPSLGPLGPVESPITIA